MFVVIIFVAIFPYLIESKYDSCELANGRLSRNVIPTNYNIDVRLCPESLTIDGTVTVYINVENATNEITIHCKNLKVTSAKIRDGYGYSMGEIKYCPREGTMLLRFQELMQGHRYLEITYNGKLSENKLRGIIALRCTNRNTTRYSLVSYFEPTYARTAFPCFDEPIMKATYSISITAPRDRTIISNMPQIKEINVNENERKVMFARTPAMSTYLVSLVVGDYDLVEQTTSDGRVRLRVYTPQGRRDEGLYALEAATRALEYLEKYLDVPYQLPKLDLVSARDYGATALESWGSIIVDETALLQNERSSDAHCRHVVSTIYHEVAHQWFGNLVTPNWWTDTWLSEGFADYFSNYLVDCFHKDWQIWSDRLSSDNKHGSLAAVLEMDALESSHAVNFTINDDRDIDLGFDNVIYAKGSYLIRMMKGWINDQPFRRGIVKYINKHEYGNAKIEDMLNVLEGVTNKPVKTVMKSWLNRKGFPTLRVHTKGRGTINTVRQDPFSYSGNGVPANHTVEIWKIPLAYTTSKNQETKRTLMLKRTQIIPHSVTDWNINSLGYYRIHYTAEGYRELFKDVSKGKIKPMQRFTLLNDYYALAKAGKVSTVDYLKYLENYENEKELYVWRFIISSLMDTRDMLTDGHCLQCMNGYIRNLLLSVNRRLLYTKQDKFPNSLRGYIDEQLGCLGHANIAGNALKLFQGYCAGEADLEKNRRSAVFTIVSHTANNETYNKYFELLNRHANDACIRSELLNAMGRSNSRHNLNKAINRSLKPEFTITESINLITTVARYKPEVAWNNVKCNYETYKQRGLSRIAYEIITSFGTTDKAREVIGFLNRKKYKWRKSPIAMAIEMVRNKENWRERNAAAICGYLTELPWKANANNTFVF